MTDLQPGPRDYRRAITDSHRIPGDPRRWYYDLACGHSVVREASRVKRQALCGWCQGEGA